MSSEPAARILIVDDEPVMVETLRFALEGAGFSCRVAVDGEEAIAAMAAETPDLVLLDVMLPKLNGYQVCRFIRESPALRAVPVIMLTARAQERDRAVGIRSGVDGYVTKPFDLEALLALVRERLAAARAAE